ncbi:MAG: 30S ribosomal protein S20 [Candidatus Sericytochromatia bacterium]
MAKRIKSGIKRVEIAERNRQRNVAVKSAIKTATKKVVVSISESGKEVSTDLVKAAISQIDKAVTKGILHKNTAARKKSRLMAKVNKAN